tara:strand:- start:48 stop:296 length:249 start_codon:yes stop_codon:yes gene_type:complete
MSFNIKSKEQDREWPTSYQEIADHCGSYEAANIALTRAYLGMSTKNPHPTWDWKKTAQLFYNERMGRQVMLAAIVKNLKIDL